MTPGHDGLRPPAPPTGSQHGSALVMAVVVLALLTALGIALLLVVETDVKASRTAVRSRKVFSIAEAGLEDAREQLRAMNKSSADPYSLTDELTATTGANASFDFVETALKASYDAGGNVTGFTGGGDDVPLRSSTSFGGGRYAAFLTNDPIDGRATLSDSNGRVMITSIGTHEQRSSEIVQAIVERVSIPPISSTITLVGPMAVFEGGSSASKNFTGNDCSGASGFTGVPGYHVPVVGTTNAGSETTAEAGVTKPSTYTSGSSTGLDTVTNIASTIHPAWLDCPYLRTLARSVKDSANYVCTAASPCTHWATATIDTITYVEGDFTAPNNGKGLLFVTGRLNYGGGDSWEGSVYAVGKGEVYCDGGGPGHNYGGTVVANIAGPDRLLGTSDDCTGPDAGFDTPVYHVNGGGNHDTIFCSDAIAQSGLGLPLKVVSFRER